MRRSEDIRHADQRITVLETSMLRSARNEVFYISSILEEQLNSLQSESYLTHRGCVY